MMLQAPAYFQDWTGWERWWLAAFTALNVGLFFVWEDTLIGLATSLTGMLTVVLVAKGKTSNYYFGIINVILYAWIAWQSRYYGEVMLNLLYFLPMQFVGIYLWRRNAVLPGADEVRAEWLPWSRRIAWGTASVIGVAAYGALLYWLRGTLPFVDATSTVLSVIAMILMVRRVVEQWVLWIVVDIVSIYMWAHILLTDGTGMSMLVMWSAYLVNAVYGLISWKLLAEAHA